MTLPRPLPAAILAVLAAGWLAACTPPLDGTGTPVPVDGPQATIAIATLSADTGAYPLAAGPNTRWLPMVAAGSAPAAAPGEASVAVGPGSGTTGNSNSADATTAPTEKPDEAPTPDPSRPSCPGIVQRVDDRLVLDGKPLFFFGINVEYLLDNEFPEEQVEPIVRELAAQHVNTLRVWFFRADDADRFGRLLDLGKRYGIRFIVTLEDNVFKGVEWFFSDTDEKKYRPHVERTVARFKDRPEILAWEVINEPNCNGPVDDGCLKTIRDWVKMSSGMIRTLDACHLISSGMIGAGNDANEVDNYRKINKNAIQILSVHRRSNEARPTELAIASEETRPLFYGEIYDVGYDEHCAPLDDGKVLAQRADRIKDDLRQAIQDGVDGYLLWDYAAGRIRRTNGDYKDYCSTFGYAHDDPLWSKLANAGLPPAVPWHPVGGP